MPVNNYVLIGFLAGKLGGSAMNAASTTPGASDSVFITQWSQVLDPRGQHGDTIARQRKVADLMEKGDAKALIELKGKNIVAWAPTDSGSLNRILSHFLRSAPANAPTSMVLIVPLPFFPGASSVEHFLDLWGHPLLGEKHVAIVKEISLIPQPVEYILPGANGPRQVRQGLACFRVARVGPRSLPAIVLPLQPLLQVTQSASLIVDTLQRS